MPGGDARGAAYPAPRRSGFLDVGEELRLEDLPDVFVEAQRPEGGQELVVGQHDPAQQQTVDAAVVIATRLGGGTSD